MSPSIDTKAAEAYRSVLVPGLFGAWAEDAVAWAEIGPGDQVLDVACGPGTATEPAARLVGPKGRAVGVDIDPGMIAFATAQAEKSRDLRLEYRCGNAQALAFENHSFDAVLCLQGLQFFPDRGAALAEIKRVMKPDARFVATVWRGLEQCVGNRAVVRALERRGIDTTPVYKPFSLDDARVLRELFNGAGFRDVGIRAVTKAARFSSPEEFVDALARGGPATRHAIAKVPAAERPAFVAEISAALQPWVAGSHLGFPMHSHVISARA
jgi:SAM-dependent methyltransferase